MAQPPPSGHNSRKRAREACEPCRRKKSRCSGEQPVCALCARLNQSCTYAGPLHNSGTFSVAPNSPDAEVHTQPSYTNAEQVYSQELDDRVRTLDDKVSEVLDQVRLLTNLRTPSSSYSSPVSNALHNADVPARATVRNAARLYLQFCHCQPLPLFAPKNLEATIFTRELEVQLCICAASLRFGSDEDSVAGPRACATKYSQIAKSIVMSKILEERVELSTLQTLCLLTFIAFNDGQLQQAGLYLALATEMARSAGLGLYARLANKTSTTEEHIRCLWSLIVLQHLCGGVDSFVVKIDSSGLGHPPSDATNNLVVGAKQNNDQDLGVVAYATQMSEVWGTVRHYVHHRGKLDQHPPWSGQSTYSKIMFNQMELESQMPQKHRFKPSGFTEHTILTLSENRLYWAPWIYLQIIYHSIVCTINHPLLMSLHVRRFRVNQIPELFLQNTSDMITSHTDWISHLLEIATDKQFEFSCPFLGQCIAITATIFLQQSYTMDQEVRVIKQAKYQLCMKTVRDLSRYWPHVEQIATKLQKFETVLSQAFESSILTSSPDQFRPVDLSLFWQILDNSVASTLPGGNNSMFGSSLRMRPSARERAELSSTNLLPEPTRVNALPPTSFSAASTPIAIPSTGTGNDHLNEVPGQFYEDPFLGQNFFALGQDFVGNADDWFNWAEVQATE